jgi:hypothetical protein
LPTLHSCQARVLHEAGGSPQQCIHEPLMI